MSDENRFKIIGGHRIAELCRPGRGADTCRYLLGGPGGLECGKHQDGFRQEIDRRSAEGTMVAKGDNCEGLGGPNVH